MCIIISIDQMIRGADPAFPLSLCLHGLLQSAITVQFDLRTEVWARCLIHVIIASCAVVRRYKGTAHA